jgi:hypothetical protein
MLFAHKNKYLPPCDSPCCVQVENHYEGRPHGGNHAINRVYFCADMPLPSSLFSLALRLSSSMSFSVSSMRIKAYQKDTLDKAATRDFFGNHHISNNGGNQGFQ